MNASENSRTNPCGTGDDGYLQNPRQPRRQNQPGFHEPHRAGLRYAAGRSVPFSFQPGSLRKHRSGCLPRDGRRELGIGKITVLVFGTIASALIYSGYCIFPFYYYYLELQNHMEQVIGVASTDTDQEIRQKLLYQIKKMQIPANPEDLKIERGDRTMKISLPYDEVFYITWRGKDYDLYTFNFVAAAEGRF